MSSIPQGGDLAASGDEGSFLPFQLWAGEKQAVTTQRRIAAGQGTLAKYTVLMTTAAGLMALASAAGAAGGTLEIAVNPAADDTVTINGHVVTFKASGAAGQQVNLGVSAALTAAALLTYINATAATGVTAVRDDDVLHLTALTGGEAGNLIALATSVPAKVTLSDDTLEGGADAGEVRPDAILAQPIVTGTDPDGVIGPVYVEGYFNHEALVWPAQFSTLDERQRLCARSPITVGKLYGAVAVS